MTKVIIFRIGLFIVLFFGATCKAQSTLGPEQILWESPDNSKFKLTYRHSLVSNTIVVRTPMDMDTSASIIGDIILSDGSFDIDDSKPPLRTKSISVKNGYFDEYIDYYNAKSMPIVTFKCTSSSLKKENDLTDEQTKSIFNLFFGSSAAKDMTISVEDRKQATLLLQELIEGSCKMAVVQGINDIDVSLYGIFKALKTAYSKCNKIKDGQYYESVRKTISNNFASPFSIRKTTGEW